MCRSFIPLIEGAVEHGRKTDHVHEWRVEDHSRTRVGHKAELPEDLPNVVFSAGENGTVESNHASVEVLKDVLGGIRVRSPTILITIGASENPGEGGAFWSDQVLH